MSHISHTSVFIEPAMLGALWTLECRVLFTACKKHFKFLGRGREFHRVASKRDLKATWNSSCAGTMQKAP